MFPTPFEESPPLRDIDFDRMNLFYRYGSPPALIHADFAGVGSIAVYLHGGNDIFIVARNSRGHIIQSIPQAKIYNSTYQYSSTKLSPLPILKIQLNLSTTISVILTCVNSFPKSAKNLPRESFPYFKQLAKKTGHDCRFGICWLTAANTAMRLSFTVRDEDFVGEIQSMGQASDFGFKLCHSYALVQIKGTSFVSTSRTCTCMLICKEKAHQNFEGTRLVQSRYSNIIWIEMMSEVEPSSNFITNSQRRKSKYTTSLPISRRLSIKLEEYITYIWRDFGVAKRLFLWKVTT